MVRTKSSLRHKMKPEAFKRFYKFVKNLMMLGTSLLLKKSNFEMLILHMNKAYRPLLSRPCERSDFGRSTGVILMIWILLLITSGDNPFLDEI